MLDALIVLFALGAVLYYAAYRRKDGTHKKSIKAAWAMFMNVFPLLIIAFILAGLLEVVIPTETITSWLGEEAGWKGFIVGPFIGALVQGGPFTFFPLFSAVFQQSVGVGTAVAMITGWGMLNVGHLPYEFAFLGPRFVLIKLGVCIAVPTLSGFAAHFFFG